MGLKGLVDVKGISAVSGVSGVSGMSIDSRGHLHAKSITELDESAIENSFNMDGKNKSFEE